MKNGASSPVIDDLGDSAEGGIDFGQMLNVLREHLWLIVLFTLVGIFAGIAYVSRMPRTFLATTVMTINTQPLRLLSFEGVQPASPAVGDLADEIVAGLKTRAFLVHVVEANKLTTDPLFLPPLPDGKPHSVDTAVDALLGMQMIVPRRGTPFIEVSVMHTDPRVAARLADAISEEHIKQSFARRNAHSALGIQFLVDEASKLKDQLSKAEEDLQKYIADKNLLSLDEKQDVVVARLKSLSGALDDARASRMRLESDTDKVRKAVGKPEELLKIISVAEHPSVTSIKGRIEGIESVIAGLALRYTEKHPKMIQARLQLKEAKDSLKQTLSEMPPLIQASFENAVATEQKFSEALDLQTKEGMDLNNKAIPYHALQMHVETQRALYDGMLKRFKEAEIAKGVEQNNVSIFERALLPSAPMQPKKSRILGIAVAAGLAIGIALSFALNALDSSIRTVEQATAITGLQVLGAIPRDPSGQREARALSMHLTPASPVAEAFRSLRASLQVVTGTRGRHTVVFTSAEPDEGKTFCAINCAIAFAQQGLRTLLIDGDLRVSMVGRMIVPAVEHPGVTDFLEGRVSCPEAIQHTDVPNLSVMTAGTPAQQPAELLASPVFGEMLQILRADYDRIVIDTVPVLAVADVLLIAEHTELVCLVVRAAKTSRKCVLRARDTLINAGVKPAGVLLNQLVFRSGSGYNRYIGKYGAPENYGKERKRESELEVVTPTNRNGEV